MLKSIEVSAIERVKVQLDLERMHQVVKTVLYDLIGLSYSYPVEHYSYCLKDGNLVCMWEESAGAHSNFKEEIMRKATDTDKAVLLILSGLSGRL